MKRTPQWGLGESGPGWWMGCEREAWKRVNSQEVVGGMGSQGWRERMYQGQIAKKMPLQWQTQDPVYYSQAMHVHGCCFSPSLHACVQVSPHPDIFKPLQKTFLLMCCSVSPWNSTLQSDCCSLRHITSLLFSLCSSVSATSQVIRRGDNPG